MSVGIAGVQQRPLRQVSLSRQDGTAVRTFADSVLPARIAPGMDVSQLPKGFGIDTDGDGKFSSNSDGFLTLDLNRDGRYDTWEVQRSNDILTAFTNPGQAKDAKAANFARTLDVDGDGVLAAWELQRHGARVAKVSDPLHTPIVTSTKALPGGNPEPQPLTQPRPFTPQPFQPNPFFNFFMQNMFSWMNPFFSRGF